MAWLTWFVVLLPPRAGRRELQMSVYFVGFLAASAVLVARSPWFAFFCWIGFVHAFRYLTGGWRYAGVIATAVLLSIGQTGGFHHLTAPLIAVYVAITLLNAAVVISFSYLGEKAAEQSTQRQQMIVDLAEANRLLEETMAENAGLHAQLLSQAREAGVLEERQRMAREIHDTLAQGLIGIITQLEAVQRSAPAPPGNAGSTARPSSRGAACPKPAGRSRPCGPRRWPPTRGCPRRWPRWPGSGRP